MRDEDPRQIEMFPGFDDAYASEVIYVGPITAGTISGYPPTVACRLPADSPRVIIKGGPRLNTGLVKHCLVFCGDRCDCGRSRI